MNALTWVGPLPAELPAILVDAGWKSAVVLLAAAVTLRVMARSSAAARHCGLLSAVAGLLALPVLSWTLPRLEVLPSSWTLPASGPQTAAEAPLDPPFPDVFRPAAATSDSPRSPLPFVHEGSSVHESPARPTSPNPGALILRWLPALWLGGVIFALLPAMGGLLSLRRLSRRAAITTSGPLFEKVRRLTPDPAAAHRIVLLTTSERRMPMTWGWVRPRLLLPAQAVHWPEPRLRAVLLHELAHIQRRDFATTLLTRFVCALYWFNPLVWMAASRLRREQEQACDDCVLLAGARPSSYAEDVLQFVAGRDPGDGEPFGALAMARCTRLEERLSAILDDGRRRTRLNRSSILLTLSASALALVPMAMLRAAQALPVTAAAIAPVSPPPADVGGPSPTASSSEPGLVAWWRAEGDGKDSAGRHDGEFPFGISYRNGRVGRAFDFRRSYAIQDQLRRVSIPDSPDFQLSETLTIEARIYPIRFGGIILIRGDDRPGFDTWQLDVITPGKISFNFDDAENRSEDIRASLQVNQWYHVVATFDRGTMKLYLNGALVAQSLTDLRPNPILDPRHDPALGIGNTGGKYYSIPFDGLIDEVKIYNRALNDTEVAARARP